MTTSAFRPPATLPSLTPLEIATGMLFGSNSTVRVGPTSESLRRALTDALLPALQASPCFLSFSGGRDSSALLAVGVDVARAHGLADPIPLTMDYVKHPRTFESEWQQMVVTHLGLRQWEHVPVRDEVEALGRLSRNALLRHGLYWPPNAQAMLPLLSVATGGSLITGNGGDELFTWAGTRWSRLAWAARARNKRAARAAVRDLLPRVARRVHLRCRQPVHLPWLTREGQGQLTDVIARSWDQQNSSWRDSVESWLGARYLHVAQSAFHTFAAEHGVLLVEPFLSTEVAESLVASAPAAGFGSRTEALRHHFADLLPDEVLTRSSKAAFTEVLWGAESRDFAAAWDGTGLDDQLVDAERLRAVWTSDRPDFRSVSALQAAWLGRQQRGVGQA